MQLALVGTELLIVPGPQALLHRMPCGIPQGEDKFEGKLTASTIVLYLTEEFTGGATHYLPGPDSEVPQAVAVTPAQGAAVVHRQNTVLHCGGEVESGTKYIMQVSVFYSTDEATPPPANIVWGVADVAPESAAARSS